MLTENETKLKNFNFLSQQFQLRLLTLFQTYANGTSAEESGDICATNSHRKHWADRKCSVLISELFEVSVLIQKTSNH